VALHPDLQPIIMFILALPRVQKRQCHNINPRKFDGKTLSEVTQILKRIPIKGNNHFGAHILFLPDKTLLISLGEGFDYKEEAQNLMSDLGKIMHLKDDGTRIGDQFAMPHAKVQRGTWESSLMVIATPKGLL